MEGRKGRNVERACGVRRGLCFVVSLCVVLVVLGATGGAIAGWKVEKHRLLDNTTGNGTLSDSGI